MKYDVDKKRSTFFVNILKNCFTFPHCFELFSYNFFFERCKIDKVSCWNVFQYIFTQNERSLTQRCYANKNTTKKQRMETDSNILKHLE